MFGSNRLKVPFEAVTVMFSKEAFSKETGEIVSIRFSVLFEHVTAPTVGFPMDVKMFNE